jgi:hypothetical protein
MEESGEADVSDIEQLRLFYGLLSDMDGDGVCHLHVHWSEYFKEVQVAYGGGNHALDDFGDGSVFLCVHDFQ